MQSTSANHYCPAIWKWHLQRRRFLPFFPTSKMAFIKSGRKAKTKQKRSLLPSISTQPMASEIHFHVLVCSSESLHSWLLWAYSYAHSWTSSISSISSLPTFEASGIIHKKAREKKEMMQFWGTPICILPQNTERPIPGPEKNTQHFADCRLRLHICIAESSPYFLLAQLFLWIVYVDCICIYRLQKTRPYW